MRLPSKLALATALQALALQVLFTTIAWPAKSSDMSCLYFWFWMVVMEGVRKSRPSTLTIKLKAVVEAFAESVDPEEVKRSARSTWNRTRACKKILKRLEQ